MGVQKNVPNIKPGDWTSVRQVISRLASRIGPASTPTFSGLTLSNPLEVLYGGTGAVTLTDHGILLGSGTGAITPLGVATNGQLPIGSTGADPVLATLTGTANQVTVTNGAGSITLSLPQNIHTGASPIFSGLRISGSLEVDGVIHGDLEEDGHTIIKLGDNIGSSQFIIKDSDVNTVAYIDSNGGIYSDQYSSEPGGVLFVNNDGYCQADDEFLVFDSENLRLGIGKAPSVALDVSGAIAATSIVTATGFTIGANTLNTNEFAYLDGQNQAVKTTSSPIFAGLTLDFTLQDYVIKERVGAFVLDGQVSGKNNVFEQFTEDGDTTDSVTHNMFVRGTVDSLTAYELLQIGYIAGDAFFRIRSVKSGDGAAARAIKMWTESNTDQFVLATDGNVGINDAFPAEKLDINGNANVTGVYKVDDVQVIGNQQAHIADATTQDLTGTDTIDQTKLESDLAGIVAAIAAINLMAETHGLIADS